MSVTTIYPVRVEFGDCDPAGIVFYPNFFRWYDAASRWYFTQRGVPPWRETEATRGIIGTPLLEASSRFVRPASYGETVEVHTSIVAWAAKTFTHEHRLMRDGELLAEGREVRAFVVRDPARGGRLKAIPVPQDIRALCEATGQ